MNGFEFYELAKKTRAAQRLYFKSRLHGDLINAKNLERELDRAIEAGIETTPVTPKEEVQENLFNTEEGK